MSSESKGVTSSENTVAGKSERWPLGQISLGVASVLFATSAVAQTTLPTVSVETKKAPAKSKAKSSTAPAQTTQQPQQPQVSDGVPAALLPNNQNQGTGMGRMPGTLQSTPQTVNVVGQQQIKEQNITTVDQALRNVPGVSVSIGEGGGGLNGDQFRIRGFQAKGDLYVDGLRDFGSYTRDAFAYEQVQVFKGPSSENFGMGTGGGAINLQQKTAHLGNETNIEQTFGTGPMFRTMIDVNKQINSTTAARAVMMYHDQDMVDRDHVFSNRWGFLGSLAFGLGTDTTLTLNYLHQHGDRTPEYGSPMAPRNGYPISKSNPAVPISDWLVPRSNFYGKETDKDITDVDMLTARLKSKLSENVTLFSDTRLAYYQRDFSSGPAECAATTPNPAVADPSNPTQPYTSNCQTEFNNGNYDQAVLNYGGGNPSYVQDSWGIQNITSILAKFNTGALKHEFVAGIDAYYQTNDRTLLSITGTKNPAPNGNGWVPSTITNPVYENVTGYFFSQNPTGNGGQKVSEATNIGLFASDRLWLTKELSILGGVRWDDFRSDLRYWCNVTTENNNTPYPDTCNGWRESKSVSDFVSPKASVIWEPTKSQTYYASWSRSFAPTGQFVANEVNSVGITPGQDSLSPEVSETYELGAKYSVMGGKLGFGAAVFEVKKDNASYTDPQGDAIPSGEVQRVRGIELSVTGRVTDAWTVQAAYTYLDSKILDGKTLQANTGGCYPATVGCTGSSPTYVDPVYVPSANIGNKVQQVPENAVSIWTTYNLSTLMNTGKGVLTVGGGMQYVDGYFTSSANNAWVPYQLSFDGLIQYEIEGWRLAMNGYNLTDAVYYLDSQSSRATPAAGRTLLFTVGKKF